MPWKPGQSGNLAGRPAGRHSPDNRIKKAMPQILENLVDKALDGDPVAGAAIVNYRLHQEVR